MKKRLKFTTQPGEVWKSVAGFPKYDVSNLGRVASFVGRSPIILRPGSRPYGYQLVILRGGYGRFVHRLVAQAFLGDPPLGHEVNHRDGNPANNRLENLEYMTRRQNMMHAIERNGGHWMKGVSKAGRAIIGQDLDGGPDKAFTSIFNAAKFIVQRIQSNGGPVKDPKNIAPNIHAALNRPKESYGYRWIDAP